MLIKSRFRILKGGKISLVVSALATTIMASSASAADVDYFDTNVTFTDNYYYQRTGDISGDEHIYADRAVDNGNTSDTRASSSYDDVFITPEAVQSTYTGVSYVSGTDTEFDVSATSYTLPTTFQLTFSNSANAGNIQKNNITIYRIEDGTARQYPASNSTTYMNMGTYTGTYYANLVFQGNNEVTGTINVAKGTSYDGTVDVEDTLTFGGAITAGTVSFNTDENALAAGATAQVISQDIHSNDTHFYGHATSASNFNIVSSTSLGDNVTIHDSTVVVNTASDDVATSSSSDSFDGNTFNTVTFTNTANSNGTLSITEAKTDSTFAEVTGHTLTTAGSTLNFTMQADDYSISSTAGDTAANLNATNTSTISEDTTGYGTLTMNGNETINIGMLSSFRDNIDNSVIVAGTNGGGAVTNMTLNDNSYVIDTALTRNSGNLVVTTDRDATTYVTKSGLLLSDGYTSNNGNGHFITNGATVFATRGMTGTDYVEDMQTVFNLIDIDQHGYGNNETNLAVEIKRMAPIVNTSLPSAAIAATNKVVDTLGTRITQVRSGFSSGDEMLDGSVWIKYVAEASNRDAVGDYDGYNTKSNGVVIGMDKELSSGTIFGMAFAGSKSKTVQNDFREGDVDYTDSYQASLYSSKLFGNHYVNGTLSFTKHTSEGTRANAVDRTSTYETDAKQYAVSLEGGRNVSITSTTQLTPFIAVEYSKLSQDAYTETGSDSINLEVAEIDVERGSAGVGLKYTSSNLNIGDIKDVLTTEFKVGAYKYFGDDTIDVTAQYIGDTLNENFITPSSSMIDTLYSTSFGMQLATSQNSTVSLNGKYSRSDDGTYDSKQGQVEFKLNF